MSQKAEPITFESYREEVKILRAATSSGPYIIIHTMAKTEILDPDLS